VATVLVVDDEADIRELVRINLELDGHRVLTAADGPAALEALRQESPDLILLDVMMPGVDGWKVLGAIKADTDEALAQTPVMMVTARDDDLDRIKGAIEGAIRYITKPFTLGDLRTEVRNALESDEPETAKRRRAQQAALEHLARLESGDRRPPDDAAPAPRPHLTRLERTATPAAERRPSVPPAAMASLSEKQAELLRALAAVGTVREAADGLSVSRSNVYASLRRIARKLGVRSVTELVTLAKQGDLFPDQPAR
jgi:DNA-binding response OmpR family regulator